MSILIKGMEMPESCSDCFFDYDSIVCMALNKEFPDRSSDDGFYAYCSGRMPDCPLVEVSSEDVQPVEHGRWIFNKPPNNWAEMHLSPKSFYVCDICGHIVDDISNYCPGCGAVMDGGDF